MLILQIPPRIPVHPFGAATHLRGDGVLLPRPARVSASRTRAAIQVAKDTESTARRDSRHGRYGPAGATRQLGLGFIT
jgi:hypothetical protein